MSPRKKFDHIMVHTKIGGNTKVGRLTDPEFRCLVSGVWSVASDAPIRGYLLVGDDRATPDDIARASHQPKAVATRTLEKMRKLGMLVMDHDVGAERCHDWDDHQPKPKTDNTNAERQARWRLNNAHRNASSNGVAELHVTTPEVEGEVEDEERRGYSNG